MALISVFVRRDFTEMASTVQVSWAPFRRRASAVPNLNSGIEFDKGTAEARRLNQTFELSSASN